jgi:alanine dehydrogenase
MEMKETDDSAIGYRQIFIDSRETAIGQIGALKIPISNGTFLKEEVLSDHYQLNKGKHPGRIRHNDIRYLKIVGVGHLDLMTARYIDQRCQS